MGVFEFDKFAHGTMDIAEAVANLTPQVQETLPAPYLSESMGYMSAACSMPAEVGRDMTACICDRAPRQSLAVEILCARWRTRAWPTA